jgi:thiol:disulfide interchange protein
MNLSSSWYKRANVMILQLMTLQATYWCALPPGTAEALPQAAGEGTSSHNVLADGYDPHRDPEKDLAAASAEAKKSNRNIFVEVGGDWCSWCHVMDRFFHDHPDLEALRDKNYVSMKVNMSQENPNRAFLSRFPRIHGYPHIFILDAAGNLIQSQSTNVLEDGRSYNAKRFNEFLERFAPKVGD